MPAPPAPQADSPDSDGRDARAKSEPPDPLDGPLLVVPSCCATGSSQATAAALAVTACALMIPAAGTLRTPCRRRRSSMKPLSASTSAAAGKALAGVST